MTNKHAFLAPSAADTWVKCALYPTMAASFPDDGDPEASSRGTAAHWVAAELHERRPVLLGTKDPDGTVVDEDILETAEWFASSLHGVTGWRLEQRLESDTVHAENWGTPDAWTMHGFTLDITDWKGGHGHVEVYENWQLINYFALIWAKVGRGYDDQSVTVRFRIVQPNAWDPAGVIRTWTVKASDLRAHVNLLRAAAEEAFRPNPTARPGPHCKHCPGRHACQALEREALNVAAAARRPGVVDILPVSAQARELAWAQEGAALLDAFITGRSAQLAATIESGTQVPGFSMEHGRANERWTKTPEEILAVGKVLGVDLTKAGTVTPKQARDKGVPAAIVAGMSMRPKGELKLKRVNIEKLSSMFGKIN